VVGNRVLLNERGIVIAPAAHADALALEQRGTTVFFAACEAELVGLVGVADTVRPDAAAALATLRELGIKRLLQTGDSQRVAVNLTRFRGHLRDLAGQEPSRKGGHDGQDATTVS